MNQYYANYQQLNFDHKIKDTLKPNTTYSFNFGQSIATMKEILQSIQIHFSTGNYIDSLVLGGKIKDAYQKKLIFVSVIL
jgi:hypothetical protein